MRGRRYGANWLWGRGPQPDHMPPVPLSSTPKAMTADPQRQEGRLVGIVSGKMDDKYYGFIAVPGQKHDYFFHATGLKGIEFEEISPGDRVSFLIVDTEKGPRAVGVERSL